MTVAAELPISDIISHTFLLTVASDGGSLGRNGIWQKNSVNICTSFHPHHTLPMNVFHGDPRQKIMTNELGGTMWTDFLDASINQYSIYSYVQQYITIGTMESRMNRESSSVFSDGKKSCLQQAYCRLCYRKASRLAITP